jgi:hypothetical protein
MTLLRHPLKGLTGFDFWWDAGIFNDRKIHLNIPIKNDKLPFCTSSNPGHPDSDNKNFKL